MKPLHRSGLLYVSAGKAVAPASARSEVPVRARAILAAFALVTLAAMPIGIPGGAALAHSHEGQMPAEPLGPLSTDSIYNLDARWTDQDGSPAMLADLTGKPRVVAMGYTTCQYVCPLIVDKMKQIEHALTREQQSSVGFAFFSFDPERDTPAALKAYAAKRNLNEAHWRLYTAKPDDVLELAALLGVRYRKEPDGEFSHSTIITVLDRQGVIRYQMLGLDQELAPLMAALHAALGSGDPKGAKKISAG